MVKIRRMTVRQLIGCVVLLTLLAAAIGWRGGAMGELDANDTVGLPSLVCSGGKPNGVCDAEEKAKGACPEDCGGGSDEGGGDSGGGASCDNDNICEPESGEATFNCGDCPPVCGDAICAAEEVDTCLDDCSIDVTCGDGLCSAFENEELCALDCTGATEEPVQPANQPPAIATITVTPNDDDPADGSLTELTPQIIETPEDIAAGDDAIPDKQGSNAPTIIDDEGDDFDAASPYLIPGQNRGTFILIGLLAVGLIIIVCIGYLVLAGGFMANKHILLTRGADPGVQMGGGGNDIAPTNDDQAAAGQSGSVFYSGGDSNPVARSSGQASYDGVDGESFADESGVAGYDGIDGES